MIDLSPILVAHDFSGHADAALRRSIDLARATGAKLHLLHCYGVPLGGVTPPYDAAITPEVWEMIRDAAAQRLERVRSQAAAQGVGVSAEVTPGSPVEAIVAIAERVHAGLIAVGTRGLGVFKHALLGSVAERVTRVAPCPVLAVKEGDRVRTARRVAVATDFSEPGDHALRCAIGLARLLGAPLDVIHAFDVPVEPVTRYGISIPTDLVSAGRAAARRKLDAAVAQVRAAGLAAEGHLVETPAAPAIAEVAGEIDADLVVIGTHGYTGVRHVLLGSVAERTLRLAPCAVLAVKPTDARLAG